MASTTITILPNLPRRHIESHGSSRPPPAQNRYNLDVNQLWGCQRVPSQTRPGRVTVSIVARESGNQHDGINDYHDPSEPPSSPHRESRFLPPPAGAEPIQPRRQSALGLPTSPQPNAPWQSHRQHCRRRERQPTRWHQRLSRSFRTSLVATSRVTVPPALPPARARTSATVGEPACSISWLRRYSWSD